MKTPPLFLSLLTSLLCALLPVRGAAQGVGLDPTFHFTGQTFTADSGLQLITSIVLQPDGKIVLNGIFDPSTQPPTHTLARLNTDGSVDTAFKVTMSEYGYVDEVAMQADGKILIAGEFTTVNGTASNGLARLNTDGSLDSSFNPITLPPPFYGLIVQPDGKILVDSSSATSSISRLNSDGSVDAAFTVLGNDGAPIALQTNGKILCTDFFPGAAGQYDAGVIRINADGTADTSFRGVVFDDGNAPTAMVEQPDGKIIVVGNFNTVGGATHTNIVRLNSDSTVDTSFKAGTDPDLDTGDTNGEIFAVALQTDGKVLIGGVFTEVDGVAHSSLARLNTDGTLDTSFATGAVSADMVTAVAVQTDGKAVVSGIFFQAIGTKYYLVDRFDPHPAFFSGEVSLSSGVDYLKFPNGNPFGYYSYLSDEDYLYHFDLGYEYVFDAADGNSGVYFYDFASNTFFYTSPVFPFPYLYDFTLGTVLYYYPDTANPGHYTANPRYFYDFATGEIIMK